MRFFEQRPFKEIADILGITESNAKVRTYRVLERIKKIMLQEGRNSDILNP
jgi:RNA polymerase sigma-70 factor (ECF subfamily)